MQVELDNKKSINIPLLGHIVFGTDEDCDVILSSDSTTKTKYCSVIYDKSTCIIEVSNHSQVSINNYPIKEMAILHPGDIFLVGDKSFKITDDNKLPKNCNSIFKFDNYQSNDFTTSVSGLRSYNKSNNGEFHVINHQKSFTYNDKDNGVSFSISCINNQLTISCKKNNLIYINGNQANCAILENGDYITTKNTKFRVESPGTSSFSKYNPSHPRNILLSEEHYSNEITKKKTSDLLKKNLWWLTLLVGLGIIAVPLYYLKNY